MSHDPQAPTTPSSSSSTRSFLDRFSGGSLLSLASIKTVLPRYEALESNESRKLDSPASTSNASPTWYSPVDSDGTWDGYSGSPAAESELWTTSPPISPRNEVILPPPRYSVINPRNSIILPWIASSAIAAASHVWQASEFRYSFTVKSNRPWATLHLYTRDAVPGNIRPLGNQPEVPRIWGCDPIAGMLQLEFESPQTVQQINIMLKGKIATSSLDEGSLPFLSHEFTVWKRSFGDPSQYTESANETPGLAVASSPRRKFDGKFMGEYSFPFSFPFPTHVDPLTKSAVLSNPQKMPRRTLDQILEFDDQSQSRDDTPLPASPLHQTTPRRSDQASRNLRQRSTSSATASSSTSSGYSPTRLISRSVARRQVSPEPQARLQPENNRSEEFTTPTHASPMPPTFLEKEVSSEISYEISAVIHRGIFKNNSRIKTNISYLPATHPLPASQKRRQAYATGALIPAPMNDPDGWLALPTTTIEGEFAVGRRGQRYAEIECTLYLAQPLSYTRGTVLPCFLTFASDDVELLDCLARPDTPMVRLMRRVRHFTTETRETRMDVGPYPLSPRPTALATFNDKEALKTVLHEVDKAVWWVPAANEVPQEPYVRHLDGEIHISEDLQPSCDCKIFHIEYFVEMLSLYTAVFQPDPRPEKARVGQEIIASTPVEITTLCRQDEPVPIPFSEPQRPTLRRISLDE